MAKCHDEYLYASYIQVHREKVKQQLIKSKETDEEKLSHTLTIYPFFRSSQNYSQNYQLIYFEQTEFNEFTVLTEVICYLQKNLNYTF